MACFIVIYFIWWKQWHNTPIRCPDNSQHWCWEFRVASVGFSIHRTYNITLNIPAVDRRWSFSVSIKYLIISSVTKTYFVMLLRDVLYWFYFQDVYKNIYCDKNINILGMRLKRPLAILWSLLIICVYQQALIISALWTTKSICIKHTLRAPWCTDEIYRWNEPWWNVQRDSSHRRQILPWFKTWNTKIIRGFHLRRKCVDIHQNFKRRHVIRYIFIAHRFYLFTLLFSNGNYTIIHSIYTDYRVIRLE